jgi:hypothetical protein
MSGEEFEWRAISVKEYEGYGAWRSARIALLRKPSQTTVTSVTTVTPLREPHREGLLSVTIGVTIDGAS